MKTDTACQSCGSACGLCVTQISHFSVNMRGKCILEDINLQIHCGQLTALVGPNGAGKSTLFKAILGEVPHEGQLQFLNSEGKRSARPRIGYVPQRLNFDPNSPITVSDLFVSALGRLPALLGGSRRTISIARQALDRVEAQHLINRRLGALSGGELQRVLLALALEPVPDLLLLDEPISGVDFKGMQCFYQIVAELRKQYDLSVLLVSHDLNAVADYADRVILLNRVILCDGTPLQVMKHPLFESTMGIVEHRAV